MAFVIAYDEAPVVEAIRERYPNNASSERMAKQYLEKIVQVPVRVPRLSADGVRTYLTLTMLDRRVDATELQSMITYANGRRQRGETPVLDGHGVQIADDASDAVRLAERLAPVLYAPLEGNPRRLKRFLNDYWMRSATAGSRNIDLDADALAKLMVLEQLHETQFAEVVRWSAEGLAGERLQAIESDEVANLESWAMPELRVWARLEPQLAGLNLGQYMELAASLRAIPFSGVGLPPELQAILAKLTSNNPVVRKAGQTEAKELDAALRVPLALALIDLLPRVGSRRGELAEAIPDLVNGSDEVGKAIVESVRKLDPGVVEPALMVRLSSCSVPTTSVFLVEAREDMRYSDSVRKAIPEPKR